jgi:hypothetical protein
MTIRLPHSGVWLRHASPDGAFAIATLLAIQDRCRPRTMIQNEVPTVSPDGTRIAFLSDRMGMLGVIPPFFVFNS